MRKRNFTRIICLTLAMLFLVSGGAVSVGAAEGITSNTVKSDLISKYEKELGIGSYEAYMKDVYPGFFTDGSTAPKVTDRIVFEIVDLEMVFTDSKNNVIEIKNGGNDWKLTTAKDANGNFTVYNSVDEAVAAGFKKSDLVFVTEEFGKRALYTPKTGECRWTLDLGAHGITQETLSCLEFVYYPVLTLGDETVAKSSAIERQFSLGTGVNISSPFKEAHALRFSKVWASYRSDAVGQNAVMVCNYYPSGKETADGVKNAANEAGLTAAVKTDAKNVQFVEIIQPKVITEAISKFISEYELRFFTVDSESNELRPSMQQSPEWISYTLRDSEGFYSEDFGFVLKPDENGKLDFSLEAVNEPMVIAQIVLAPYEPAISYADYMQNLQNGNVAAPGQGFVKIEAESTLNTSTNVVYPVEDRTSPATSPNSTKKVLLNTIGTEKWATSGQWVEYKFKVDSSGLYDVVSRFKQSYLDGLYVNRSMQLFVEDFENAEAYKSVYNNTYGYYDGIPFKEAGALRYDYDTAWQVTTLSNGTDFYQLYLEKDVVYTLRLEVTLGSMSSMISLIESILNDLNDDYLKILQLTGTEPDDYRDYGFFRLLPKVFDNMLSQIEKLNSISNTLKSTAGVASTYSGICDKLSSLIDRMLSDENEIAKNLDNFKSYVGSLGTFLSDAKTQPLQLDYILIQPAQSELPDADGNFFEKIFHEISSFIQSFFRDYNSMGAMDTGDNASESIEVWMVSGADQTAYGRDQLQVVRNMCTNDFTNNITNGKIAVDLKLVSAGTLLPSILAGMGPDVYMGLAQGNVINYAIRGALQEIEGMEGFDSVKNQFNEAAMIVLRMNDADDVTHYYGLPETQQFPMMFVRIDILANLGVDIPTTWAQLYDVQSKLESNNMEIGVTTNYRIFLYQNGGELFADNGMRINLDSKVGLSSFTEMCNMFTQYSFPYKYEAANRFRTGEMPIIISDYTALYNKLKVFATELEGCWAFVPLPGVENKTTGEINNCSISAVTATVMIKGTDKLDASWEYMKWFTGDYAQAEFSNEMVAIIGDSAKHSTANISALENMPWTQAELEQVKAQFNNLAAVPNYPGYYILDRYTNFAFLSAYNDDADPANELLNYINTINKEITRKREEFNLETIPDIDGITTLADKRLYQADEAIKALKEKHNNEKYNAVFEEAASIYKNIEHINEDDLISRLRALGEDFKKFLDANDTSYVVNITKQTAEKKNGGYAISELSENSLLYFIAECFGSAASAFESYKVS